MENFRELALQYRSPSTGADYMTEEGVMMLYLNHFQDIEIRLSSYFVLHLVDSKTGGVAIISVRARTFWGK